MNLVNPAIFMGELASYGARKAGIFGLSDITPAAARSQENQVSTNRPVEPTKECYDQLQQAFAFLNTRLFGGTLPPVMLTLQRRTKTCGYFSPKQFARPDGNTVGEIAVNPAYFATTPLIILLSFIAHDMCHAWRTTVSEEPPRRCYHDIAWAKKMREIGLEPSDTGLPGGKHVGERMTHMIRADGLFMTSMKELLDTQFSLVWYDRFPASKPQHLGLVTAKDPADHEKTVDYFILTGDMSQEEVEVPAGQAPTVAGSGEIPSFPAKSLMASNDSEHAAQTTVLSNGEPESVDTGGSPTFHTADHSPASAFLKVARAPANIAPEPPAPSTLSLELPASDVSGRNTKEKYTCSGCKLNMWGKPNAKIRCGACNGFPEMLPTRHIAEVDPL